MKSIILTPFGILSAILFCACATDTEETVSATGYASYYKSSGSDIGNMANPYDNIGLQYRNFLTAYKSGNFNADSFAAIQAIVQGLTNGTQLLGAGGGTATQELLSRCMNSPETALSLILEQSNLSQGGKDALSGFINNYENLSQEPFSLAYSEIVAMENAVSSSTTLPDYDQRVILTVASITRYSLYHSCCEDTDWKKSVGNIIAAVAGAMENDSCAIQYPLVTSIAGFEKIQF